MHFNYRSFPNAVVFGTETIQQLPERLAGYQHILVLASSRVYQHVEQLKHSIGDKRMSVFSAIVQHVPKEVVTEALAFNKKKPADVVVALGGGSAIGLAKAIALETEKPIIAIPSTFSGSEQTNIWGISNEGIKTTGRSDVVLPKLVIYDTNLTASMPLHLAVTSAMNAMAHLMEAIYAHDGNPLTRHQALLGMHELKHGMELLGAAQHLTREANEKLLLGAYVAGKCLNEVSMSLHHKMAHVLGGSFKLEHSNVHTVLQSFVLCYQWPYLSEEIKNDFMKVLGPEPAHKLQELSAKAGGPTNLKGIGFQKKHIGRAVEMILATLYANVAPLEKAKLMDMLHQAYEGNLE